jgi:hypothetical protein
VDVGGWCTDDAHRQWRRKTVRLLAEGSVIGWPGTPVGRLIDATPEADAVKRDARFENGRRVYRYGLAFPVDVRKEAL